MLINTLGEMEKWAEELGTTVQINRRGHRNGYGRRASPHTVPALWTCRIYKEGCRVPGNYAFEGYGDTLLEAFSRALEAWARG